MRKLSATVTRLVPAWWLAFACAGFACAGFAGQAQAQKVVDEARQAGRAAPTLPAADEDYFHDMDGGMQLSPNEVKGRNMWIVWTGGNDRLWDRLTNLTFGAFDLLKILSSHPGLKYRPRQPLGLSRAGQRAVLRQGHRPRSAAFRPVARQAQRRTARPIRSRTSRNIRASRSARAARISRLGSYYG